MILFVKGVQLIQSNVTLSLDNRVSYTLTGEAITSPLGCELVMKKSDPVCLHCSYYPSFRNLQLRLDSDFTLIASNLFGLD